MPATPTVPPSPLEASAAAAPAAAVPAPSTARPGLPWPLPAVLAWSAGWLGWQGARLLGFEPLLALATGCCAGALLALRCQGHWRRGLAALGFPLAAWLGGAAQGLAAAWWLLPLLPLLLVYPLHAWRDAPFFPTPAAGLQGLAEVVGQPAAVLDAGCGLGHGLRELAVLWPQARLQGVEWSPLLAWAARLRVRRAQIARADMWALPWAPFDLVYVFQRPESMARAWAKAQHDMRPGSWLVSLEFAVPGVEPTARLAAVNRRTVWIYRLQAASSDSTAAQSGR